MDESELLERVTSRYPEAVVEANGSDCSFEMYIIYDGFEGQSTLERQREVLSLFNEELKSGKLHALSIRARTHAEMANQSGLIQIQP